MIISYVLEVSFHMGSCTHVDWFNPNMPILYKCSLRYMYPCIATGTKSFSNIIKEAQK